MVTERTTSQGWFPVPVTATEETHGCYESVSTRTSRRFRPYQNFMSKYDELDQLYAKLPKINCQGLCSEVCGPISLSRMERKRLEKRVGYPLVPVWDQKTKSCVILRGSRCLAYHIRPMICRLWGLINDPRMRCRFGCVPERWLTGNDFRYFMDRVCEISGQSRKDFYNDNRAGFNLMGR